MNINGTVSGYLSKDASTKIPHTFCKNTPPHSAIYSSEPIYPFSDFATMSTN
jgi:hypothetical protein